MSNYLVFYVSHMNISLAKPIESRRRLKSPPQGVTSSRIIYIEMCFNKSMPHWMHNTIMAPPLANNGERMATTTTTKKNSKCNKNIDQNHTCIQRNGRRWISYEIVCLGIFLSALNCALCTVSMCNETISLIEFKCTNELELVNAFYGIPPSKLV